MTTTIWILVCVCIFLLLLGIFIYDGHDGNPAWIICIMFSILFCGLAYCIYINEKEKIEKIECECEPCKTQQEEEAE